MKEELTYAFRSESVNKLKALLTLIDKFVKETELVISPILVDSILMTQGGSGSKLGNRVSSAVHFAPPSDLVSANGSFVMNSGRRDLGVTNVLSARANSAIVPTFQAGVHSYGSTGALGSSRLLAETGDSVVADLIAK